MIAKMTQKKEKEREEEKKDTISVDKLASDQ